jgi:photosystem II stability/assembly factor-like uncharacterized protein
MTMSELIWRRAGAWGGGTVHSVALSADSATPVALAATDAGVFRSMDGGRTWSRASGLAYTPARAAAIAPGDGRTAFVAAQDGALFRSADAGLTWQRQSSWAFGPISALALSPNFGVDGALFAATTDGIYRSLDGGRSWQNASFGLLDGEVLCLACAPDFATSEVVWAGSATGGLFKSRNAGRAWRESGEGLIDSAVQCIAYSFAGSTLFAGTEDGGVYRLTNGQSWEACGLDGLAVNCLAAAAEGMLAGTSDGIFLSGDDGQSWQSVMHDDGVLALAASAGNAVAGGMTTGVLTSADGGRTWHVGDGNSGSAAHVPPLVACAADGALFVFDAVGAAARSIDGAAAWQRLNLEAAEGSGPIECVAASGSAKQPHVVVATARNLLRWQPNACAFGPLTSHLALAEDDAITALAITPDGTLMLGTRQGGAAISTDDGASWHSIAVPGAGIVSVVRLTPAGGLFVLRLAPASGDAFNAEVWHLPALVLPLAQQPDDWHMALALDAVQAPLACMTVVSDEVGDEVVLAAQNVVAVATLADGQAHTATLPGGTSITSLIVANRHMFVGTNSGVFASPDGGITWQRSPGDLGDAPVVALFAAGPGVGAVTLGGDVWRCELSARA